MTGEPKLSSMGATRVYEPSADELRRRRKTILERLGVSFDELSHRAETSSLVGGEWEAWEELEDIAFLLGEPGLLGEP